ncbi:hypothetical protein [Novosphingobium pentaromativorans]|uniref:Uncharacterized protein n=1 Tax=Novosphingobium pentaromativorans US6-1 TaxID=1088721 RepID=G6EBQ7_9SPHN|nr:hypothetical protein [Novosphingobium pentaromativorans]AIT80297.1 hypothetical protein JI59_11185 [Novosphingobium pentaromativorans US6-1]EHJ61339.1 hypothetical protein NSU_1778 [Novosphingobium pentaromativorans US6-1]
MVIHLDEVESMGIVKSIKGLFSRSRGRRPSVDAERAVHWRKYEANPQAVSQQLADRTPVEMPVGQFD